MPNINVSSSAEFIQALQEVGAGDSISLAPGDYANIGISNLNVGGPVVITSQDPAHPAVLEDLTVSASSGLRFAGLDFTPSAQHLQGAFQVLDSTDIAFDHLVVTGDPSTGHGSDLSEFLVRDSSNISLTNASFDLFDVGSASLDGLGPPVPLPASEIDAMTQRVLRDVDPATSAGLQAGVDPQDLGAVVSNLVKAAVGTTSIVTLSFEFFTGSTPTEAGVNYLVSSSAGGPSALNSAYFQGFNLENRYIQFATDLGKDATLGAAFTTTFSQLNLADATRLAYANIFGVAPSDAEVSDILDTTVQSNGMTMSRAAYFASYGHDGVEGIGTKAAVVGWLLGEAAKADLGVFALSNDAFLADVATNNAPFGVDVVATYGQSSFILH